MQCPNRECGATVDDGAHACPQCWTDLSTAELSGPGGAASEPHKRPSRRLANTSFALGVLSCPLLWFAAMSVVQKMGGFPVVTFTLFTVIAMLFMVVGGIAAVVAGSIALARGVRARRGERVIWRPLAGILIGGISAALVIVAAVGTFHKGRLNADLATCGDNLKLIKGGLQEYASAHGDKFPPLSPKSGVLMFTPDSMPPSLDVGARLTCPSIRSTKTSSAGPASPFDDQSYFYLGYALLDDDDVEAFARAYRKRIAEGGTFDEDLVVEDGEGTRVLHRLSLDVDEVWRATKDPHSASPHQGRESGYNNPCTVTTDIPLLIERDVDHVYTDWGPPAPRGAHVLYLHDGYTENGGVGFVERGTWPMTEKTQRILAELAQSPR